MAEEVKVTNVGGDGDIASEATLASLTKAIEKLAKQTGKDPRSEAAKVQKAHNKATSEGIKVSRKYREALEDKTEETEKATATTREFNRALKGVLMGAIGQVAGSLVNLSNEFLQGGTELGDFTQHLPLIGGYLGPLAQYLDSSVSHFRDLSSTGASFNNSLIEMRESAIDAELGLAEFSGLITSNSESMRLLGSTVTTGIAEFGRMNRELKDVGEWTNLKEMGFTVEEINEGLLDYSTLTGRLGLRQRMTTRQLATGAAEYLKQLDGLAKITGRTRKELEAQVRQMSEDSAFRALQNQFEEGSEQFNNFRTSMALISGLPESVASGLRDLADGVPQTEEAIALLTAAGPELREAMMQIADGADPQVLIDALGAAGADIERFAGLEGAARNTFITQLRQANPVLADVLDAATQLQEQGTANLQESRREAARRERITESLSVFDDSVREVRAAMQGVFIDSGLFETMSIGMTSFADIINSPEFLDSVEDITSKLTAEINKILNAFREGGLQGGLTHIVGPGGPLEQAVVGAVSGLSNVIGEAFEAAITNPKVIAAIAGAMVVAGGAAALGGKALGGIGKGAGVGAASLGSGVGVGIGGLIAGISGPLAAAGGMSAKITLGGAAIGAAIASIGAGLAGASWLLGMTLPGVAQGIKEFESIDGAALSRAGDGMKTLSAGMAAFGAGSVVKGWLNLSGTIAEKLTGWAGGEGPMAQLEQFSQYDIDVEKIQENANAISTMVNALQNVAGSEIGNINFDRRFYQGINSLATVGPGLGTTVEHIQNLADIKGLDTNISALRSAFDADGVRTYNSAMEDLVETLEDLNKVLADNNDGWFSGNNTSAGDVVQQMNTNQGTSLDVDKLNSLMSQVAETLQMIYENDQKIERNTSRIQGSNIASGRISNMTN